MLVVYSKKIGKIKNIVVNPQISTIKELYPQDYEDYEDIYNCIEIEEDLFVINNQDMFKIEEGKIILNNNTLDRYK